MSHQLIRRGPKDWYCSACHQQWQTKSKAHCPGLHVVKSDEWGTLMTKTMLGRFGYKNDPASLPEPKACYRRSYDGSEPEYVPLYDRNECVRKKEIKKGRRRSGYLSEIVAPPAVVDMIERFQTLLEFEQSMAHSEDRTLSVRRYEAAADLCNGVTCAQFMTDLELAAVSFITLPIPPRHLPKGTVFTDRTGGVLGFAFDVLRSYEAYRDPDTLPLIDRRPLAAYEVAQARQRMREEAHAARHQEQRKQEKEGRAVRFIEYSAWQTPDEALPPAVQKPMFDDEGV
jgi:hypothetical protein